MRTFAKAMVTIGSAVALTAGTAKVSFCMKHRIFICYTPFKRSYQFISALSKPIYTIKILNNSIYGH